MNTPGESVQPTAPGRPPSAPPGTRFRDDVVDLWRFIRKPSLGPRRPVRHAGSIGVADAVSGLAWRRLLAWAAVLWLLNAGVLGPLAVQAASAGGSTHRLDMNNIPWFTGFLWAPLVEELTFRYGLRRPLQALWLLPIAAFAMVKGLQTWAVWMMAIAILVAFWTLREGPVRRVRVHGWRRLYRKHFGWVFYGASLGFAALHLANFKLGAIAWWMMPVLVLPQFAAGVVMGWVRMRRGIGASIVLHALYNGGPLLLLFLAMQVVSPEALGG